MSVGKLICPRGIAHPSSRRRHLGRVVVDQYRPDMLDQQAEAVVPLQRLVRRFVGTIEAETAGDQPQDSGAARTIPAVALLAHRHASHGAERGIEAEGQDRLHDPAASRQNVVNIARLPVPAATSSSAGASPLVP